MGKCVICQKTEGDPFHYVSAIRTSFNSFHLKPAENVYKDVVWHTDYVCPGCRMKQSLKTLAVSILSAGILGIFIFIFWELRAYELWHNDFFFVLWIISFFLFFISIGVGIQSFTPISGSRILVKHHRRRNKWDGRIYLITEDHSKLFLRR